jgi:uncharacterized RDD family membrane protein YckC
MAEQFQIQTSQNVSLNIEAASLGDRIIATLIDSLIRFAYVFFVIMIFGFASSGFSNISIFFVVLMGLPYIFYHLLFEIFNQGQTPGKKALELQVATLDGSPVTIRSYILRWLFRLIDFQLFSGLVAVIAVAVSDKNQRLGDMVAGTTVVKRRTSRSIRSTVYQDFDQSYEPVYIEAKSLTPNEIDLIKEVMDSKTLERNDTHVMALSEKLSAHLGIQFEEHPRKFLRTLLRDYSYLQQ